MVEPRAARRAFTLVELAIAMVVVGIAGTIVIPGLLKAREKTRRSVCERKLARILDGVLRYEATNGVFPPGRLSPDWTLPDGTPRVQGYTNYPRLPPGHRTGIYSVHVWILPHIGASSVFDQIDFDVVQSNILEAGGVPVHPNYDAYVTPMPIFICPSDPNTDGQPTENNYRYNFGGSTQAAGCTVRYPNDCEPQESDPYPIGGNGAFTIGEVGLSPRTYTDGLSKTVFFSERIKGSLIDSLEELPTHAEIVTATPRTRDLIPVEHAFDRCADYELRISPFNFSATGRWPEGTSHSDGWPFGFYSATQYNHVAPPNWEGYDCGLYGSIPNTPSEPAIITARSTHPNSVYVAFGDGHTVRVMDDIDLAVWRAIGTRNGGELDGLGRRPAHRPGRRERWR